MEQFVAAAVEAKDIGAFNYLKTGLATPEIDRFMLG